MGHHGRSHAIVLGAGLAGLFTARVVSDFYDRVTVLDRDALSGEGVHRRGLPQGTHAHDLLARGQQITEELFPGITDEMASAGAQRGDLAENVRWVIDGRPLRKSRSGLDVMSCSRLFREHHVAARVKALPHVELVENCDVLRLRTSEDRRTITGVTVARDGAEESLDAELVVDATGRGSRVPVWLDGLGYGRVEEEKRKIDLRYVTRLFRTPPEALGGDVVINTMATAEIPRGASCQRIDAERTVITAYGILGDQPPVDIDGFLTFVGSLPSRDIHEVALASEPASEPARYRFPTNLRRHYQRMADFPDGLLVIGDAVCSFNPRYGQGMTVAALEALLLRGHLHAHGRPNAPAFFTELFREVVDGIWEMVIGTDLVFPEVEGDRTEDVRQMHAHLARLHSTATRDSDVAVACLRVFGLVDPPSELVAPSLLDALRRDEIAAGASAVPG